jgi:hypothetical protein
VRPADIYNDIVIQIQQTNITKERHVEVSFEIYNTAAAIAFAVVTFLLVGMSISKKRKP